MVEEESRWGTGEEEEGGEDDTFFELVVFYEKFLACSSPGESVTVTYNKKENTFNDISFSSYC